MRPIQDINLGCANLFVDSNSVIIFGEEDWHKWDKKTWAYTTGNYGGLDIGGFNHYLACIDCGDKIVIIQDVSSGPVEIHKFVFTKNTMAVVATNNVLPSITESIEDYAPSDALPLEVYDGGTFAYVLGLTKLVRVNKTDQAVTAINKCIHSMKKVGTKVYTIESSPTLLSGPYTFNVYDDDLFTTQIYTEVLPTTKITFWGTILLCDNNTIAVHADGDTFVYLSGVLKRTTPITTIGSRLVKSTGNGEEIFMVVDESGIYSGSSNNLLAEPSYYPSDNVIKITNLLIPYNDGIYAVCNNKDSRFIIYENPHVPESLRPIINLGYEKLNMIEATLNTYDISSISPILLVGAGVGAYFLYKYYYKSY